MEPIPARRFARWALASAIGAALLASVVVACSTFSGNGTNTPSTPDGAADDGPGVSPGDGGGSTPDAAGANPDGGSGSDAAGITPVFVQSTSTSVKGPPSAQVSWTLDLTAHSVLVAGVTVDATSHPQSGPPTVVDTLGNVYTMRLPVTQGSSLFYLFVAEDAKAGPDEVTAQSSSLSAGIELYLHEYSGVPRVGAVESIAYSVGPCTDGATDCMATPLMDASAPQSIIFGFGISNQVNAGTFFQMRENRDFNVTEDRLVAGPGQYQAVATKVGGPANAILGLVLRGGP
jgi:hypothetical protein